MPTHKDEPRATHERVALGQESSKANRKHGFTLARPGHTTVAFGRPAELTETSSAKKTKGRAVRPKIANLEPEGKR
jgi:hypothetical protein